MQGQTSRILNRSLIANSLLFIILYSILSFNARLASDDFYYLYLKNHFGAWDGMMFQYMNWSGRWTAHSIACSLLRFWKSPLFLPMLNLGTLTCLYLVIRQSLTKILLRLNIQSDPVLLPGLSLVLITTFFFATYNIGESWFWYIIVITYMWSLVAFLFVLNFIFEQKKKIRWMLALPAAIFIGGASESFALVFILILMILVFANRKRDTTESKINFNKSILFLSIIILSFLVSYLAPGTEIRRSLLPHSTILFKGWSYLKSVAKYFLYYLPHHAGYIFIFSFPWILFGMNFLQEKYIAEVKKLFLRKISLYFIVTLAILLVPTVYIMSDAGPDRAMLLISLVTTIYAAILFSIAGTYLHSIKNFTPIAFIVSLASILILAITVYVQSEITTRFAGEYDLRMSLLESEKSKNASGTFRVEALPDHGMLYWEELTGDTSYFTNQHLKKGLDLPFAVAVRE